jgi:hypothetical protein
MAIEVKSYVLTAASGSYADIFDALIAHFASAPGFWELKLGAANYVPGESFVVTQKVTQTHDVNFRRISTTSTNVVVDPGRTIVNCGSTASAPVGVSSQGSPTNINYTEATAAAKGVYVTETPRAVYVVCWNSTYSFATRIMGGGDSAQPYDSTLVALGCDGSIVVNGVPQLQGGTASSIFGISNTESSACLVKIGNTTWAGQNSASFGTSSLLGVMNAGVTNDILVQPICCYGSHSTLGNRIVGFARHLFLAPVRSGVIQTQLPRAVLVTPEEYYLYFNNSATASQNLLVWESGVIPSKP